MNFSILDLTKRESKGDLLAFLSESKGSDPLIIGSNSDSPNKFYSFTMPGGAQAGIVSSGLGSGPMVMVFGNKPFLIVGHDAYLSRVEIPSEKISAYLKMDGIFYSFFSLSKYTDRFIVIHELGAICLTLDLKILWRFDCDVITDYQISMDEAKLILQVMEDNKKIEIETTFGNVI